MNVLFYGNCQCLAMSIISKHKDIIFNGIECFVKSSLNKEKMTHAFSEADIIITQPIQDNYRDVEYLSTNYILQVKKPTCKVILFNSLWLNAYFPDVCYKSDYPNSLPYHHQKIIDCINNNCEIDECIKIINADDVYNETIISELAIKSCTTLENKMNDARKKYGDKIFYYLDVSKYILENYKKKQLFYTMNHPTPVLLSYIISQLSVIIGEDMIVSSDDRDNFLGRMHSALIYKSVLNCVDFKEFDAGFIRLAGCGKIHSTKEYIAGYIAHYKKNWVPK
uniref:Polysaccharide biosynthesis enzyme WcbI domain-containing protein n=1 Tax=viral metagenome TaxID=1070528 RepID=A0A6C0LHK6_9ZZZZ